MLVFLRLDPSAPPAEPGGLVMVILGKCGDLALLLIIAIGVSVWLGAPKTSALLSRAESSKTLESERNFCKPDSA